MHSSVAPDFWERYDRLSPAVQARDRKQYALWVENHWHPSPFQASRTITSIASDETDQLSPLPAQWVWIPFSGVCDFFNGDRSKNYPNRSEYVPEGIAWINTGHIDPDGSLSTERMNFISRDKYDSLSGGRIMPGDLVYCLRGATFGKTAFVTPYTEGAVASSLMIRHLKKLRGSKSSPHPVFGNFDAHQWNCMFAFHMGLHLPQAKLVVDAVKVGEERLANTPVDGT